jgi:tetratricopeptide (TPR) repeat protein
MPWCCPARALVLAAVWAAACPEVAKAAGGADTEAARERFKQGAQAYSDGRYKDAIDLFFEADRLAPNPAFAYNIGLAYEELGDAANALRWYRSYLRDLPGAPDQAEIEPRIVAAEKHLRDRGVQQVTVVSSPQSATVSLDGRRVGVAPFTTELAPGTHQMALELRGFQDAAASFELPADHAIDVALVLHRLPDPASVSRLPVSVPGSDRAGPAPPWPARIHPVTWATVAVGVAGLGAALGFEFARASAVDQARHAPTNLVGKDDYDRARSLETVAKVAAGIGGAVTLLGGVLVYFDLSAPSSSSPKVGAGLGCSGALCGARLDGRF